MSDTKQAAERILVGAEEPLYLMSDARLLAHAYLAEHDETPIDGQWLIKVGLGVAAQLGGGWMLRFYDCGPCIAFAQNSVGDQLGCDEELELPCKTRGDVRRLCRALGIELKETP